MPLDFGRPEKPVGPASHTVDLGALSVTVDAAGQLAVARRGRSLLCADVLLP